MAPQTPFTKGQFQTEVESIKCNSCGFTEDCTVSYIARVRERHQGRWICGLCSEAVKMEMLRAKKSISIEEALNRHTNFCGRFKSSKASKADNPISAIVKVMCKSLDSP